MKDGIYYVQFHTSSDNGGGIVVVKDGSVNGADQSFVYQGSLADSGAGAIAGTLQVFRWGGSQSSVMGADNYELKITGTQLPNGSATLQGATAASPQVLNISARHIGLLV